MNFLRIRSFPNYNKYLFDIIYRKQTEYKKNKYDKWLVSILFQNKIKIFFIKKFFINYFIKINNLNLLKYSFLKNRISLKNFVELNWNLPSFFKLLLEKKLKNKKRKIYKMYRKEMFINSLANTIHVNFTYNNIFFTVTDYYGNVWYKKSSRMLKRVRGSQRRSFLVFRQLTLTVLKQIERILKRKKKKRVWFVININDLLMKPFIWQFRKFINLKKRKKIKIISWEYKHKRSHNGIRLRKPRRI